MGLFKNKINNYSELSTELKESNVNFDKIYDDCVEHFTTVKAGDLNKWKRKIKSIKEPFLKFAWKKMERLLRVCLQKGIRF